MDMSNIIEACKSGDKQAIGLLYTTYYQKLLGICKLYVKDKDLAEDLFHDAFIIIISSLPKLKDNAKFEAWMTKIVRNYALKSIGKLSRVPTVPLAEALIDETGYTINPDNFKNVDYDKLLLMLDRLPEGYRKVFKMSVFDGMSHKEIAAELGIEPHSSSSQLSRAKKMLRIMLKRYWPLLLLFPITMPIFLFLYKNKKEDSMFEPSTTPVALKKAKREKTACQTRYSFEQSNNPPLTQYEKPVQNNIAHNTDNAKTKSHISCIDIAVKDSIAADSAATETDKHLPDAPQKEYANHNIPISAPHNAKVPGRCIFALAYNGNIDRNITHTEQPTSILNSYYNPEATSSPLPDGTFIPKEITNWKDYINYVKAYSSDFTTEEIQSLIGIGETNLQNNTTELERSEHHHVPFTIQISMDKMLGRRFSIGTAISYTKLESDFITGSAEANIAEHQQIHYLGMSIHSSMHVAGAKAFRLYSKAGLTFEIPIHSSMTTIHHLKGTSTYRKKTAFTAPCQWSTHIGMGIQYNITPDIGIYAEPGATYYISTGSSLETYRTEHPFMFTLPVGIRFTW